MKNVAVTNRIFGLILLTKNGAIPEIQINLQVVWVIVKFNHAYIPAKKILMTPVAIGPIFGSILEPDFWRISIMKICI